MERRRLHVLIEPSALRKYYASDCLAQLEAAYDVSYEPGGGLDEAAVSERLREAQVAVTGWGGPGITSVNLAAAPRLELIANFGGSCRHLPVAEALARGVLVINCAAGMVDAMAEATIGMALALGYRFSTADHRMRRQGDFQHHYPLSTGLTGKTVAILGLGHIGRRVAELLAAFRTARRAFDPYASEAIFNRLDLQRAESLEALMDGAQVLTIHAGWTDETTGMVTRELLARLPDGAMVINNARLPIVDEDALLAEVRAGRLKAALNMIPANPDRYGAADLAELDGLLYTSGAANVSDVYARGMSEMLTADLLRYARGERPEQVVTREWVERTT